MKIIEFVKYLTKQKNKNKTRRMSDGYANQYEHH